MLQLAAMGVAEVAQQLELPAFFCLTPWEVLRAACAHRARCFAQAVDLPPNLWAMECCSARPFGLGVCVPLSTVSGLYESGKLDIESLDRNSRWNGD